MNQISQIEKDLLSLPPSEREKLAIKAWESLAEDAAASSDRSIDPEGVELALKRDEKIANGTVTALTEAEFRRRLKETN